MLMALLTNYEKTVDFRVDISQFLLCNLFNYNDLHYVNKMSRNMVQVVKLDSIKARKGLI
jgi:hypothetical protein